MVAALGDSITAGVGARANSVLDIFTEYRYSLIAALQFMIFFTCSMIYSLVFKIYIHGHNLKMTRETQEVSSDKRKPRML